MIVKIQRPLSSNETIPPALIYNEDKTFQVFVPWVRVANLFLNTKAPKIYYEVLVKRNKVKGYIKRVPDQDW